MKKYLDIIKSLFTSFNLLLVFIFLIGVILRFHNYAFFPVAGETQDEVAWSFLGASLLQTGVPGSWSYFSGYQVMDTVNYSGSEFVLVQPVLDHPPLFGFLPGSMHYLTASNWFDLPSIVAIRFPMVLLSSLNLWLFMWWIRRLQKSNAFTISAVIMAATVPSIVWLSRVAVSENLIVTWILLILLLETWQIKKTWSDVVYALVHFALPLTKVAGIATALGSLLAHKAAKSKQSLKWGLFGLVVGLIIYGVYVATYDWNLFWQVQLQQAGRDTGCLTLWKSLLLNQALVNKPLADFFANIGLVSLFGAGLLAFLSPSSTVKDNKWLPKVIWLFIAQLAFLLISVGENTIHGWYRIVFWPLWVPILALVVEFIWEKANAYSTTLLWLLLLAQVRLGFSMLAFPSFWQYQSLFTKILIVISGSNLLFEITTIKVNSKKIFQASLFILLGLILVSNLLAVWLTTDHIFWSDVLYLQEGIRP